MRVIVIDENCKKCGGSGKVDSKNCGQIGHFDDDGNFLYNEFVAIKVDCECKRPVDLEAILDEMGEGAWPLKGRLQIIEKGKPWPRKGSYKDWMPGGKHD